MIPFRVHLAVLALLASAAPFAPAQSGPPVPPSPESSAPLAVSARLDAPKVGENALILAVSDPAGKPVAGARVLLSIGMTSMDMGTARPAVKDNGDGTYAATVVFSMAGPWRVEACVEVPGFAPVVKSFDYTPAPGGDGTAGMAGMDMGAMKGRLGPWSMTKEGSGTSWLPESSPMFMKTLPKVGRYDVGLMGFFTLNYSDAGGRRGDGRSYSNSMPMLMARRETGGGTIGANLMLSFDPVFNGEYGYPNLFQTGETAYGRKLVDYQHPHDLVSELTLSYSRPLGGGVNGFLYGGPVGEPALGGPTFAHRPSGMDVPEAPISHHWFDSTHISWGVVTAGVNTDRLQIEGSVFNGHEPDENRYAPDPIALNSASGRVTYNPTRNLSFNASYGYLNSPEASEPGVDQHRLTAAAIWSLPLKGGDNLSLTAGFGRNARSGGTSDARILEGTLYRGRDSIFARYESVDKDELVGVPEGSYAVGKLLLGGIRNLTSRGGFDVGLGGYAGLYAFPSALDPYYGRSPVTLGLFLRIRPSRMSHGGG